MRRVHKSVCCWSLTTWGQPQQHPYTKRCCGTSVAFLLAFLRQVRGRTGQQALRPASLGPLCRDTASARGGGALPQPRGGGTASARGGVLRTDTRKWCPLTSLHLCMPENSFRLKVNNETWNSNKWRHSAKHNGYMPTVNIVEEVKSKEHRL